MESGQGALYPISLNENGILELDPGVVAKQEISNLFILLKYYGYVTIIVCPFFLMFFKNDFKFGLNSHVNVL